MLRRDLNGDGPGYDEGAVALCPCPALSVYPDPTTLLLLLPATVALLLTFALGLVTGGADIDAAATFFSGEPGRE